jgi:hypothetical protein
VRRASRTMAEDTLATWPRLCDVRYLDHLVTAVPEIVVHAVCSFVLFWCRFLFSPHPQRQSECRSSSSLVQQ